MAIAASRPIRAATALAVAGGLAVGVSVPARAEPARAARPAGKAVTVDGLHELIDSYDINAVTGPYPSVGDTVRYVDHFEDATGRRLGTVYGYLAVVEKRPSDGHYIDYAAERIELADGTIRTSGLFDLTAAFGHAWEPLSAWGTAGRYRGTTGTRYFQIITSGVDLNARIRLVRR
jgi:hypothetical protein